MVDLQLWTTLDFTNPRNQRALHNPSVFLLRKELKFRTSKCLSKHSLPPNPTWCTLTKVQPKAVVHAEIPSLYGRSRAGQSWLWKQNPIPNSSVPSGQRFPSSLRHSNGVSLAVLYITCSDYEWLLNRFLSPFCSGDAAVGEGKEILLSLEENYFQLCQGSST